MSHEIWIILSMIAGLFLGWISRSYLGDQFIKEYHRLHKLKYEADEAVEKANDLIVEKQRYVAWGLGLFLASFVTVILLFYSGIGQNTAMKNSIADADNNPQLTRQGITDATKDLGFGSKTTKNPNQ